jgi:hypothetical protein
LGQHGGSRQPNPVVAEIPGDRPDELLGQRRGGPIACAGTGQDGDIRAGAKLNYKDTGRGTILDRNTWLEWEKQSDDDGIHDKDNTYTWDEAFVVHVAGLNTAPCFAGRCDWRVPNVKELQSIVNYQNRYPAVSPAFNTNCVAGVDVLAGSCTTSSSYWSSSPVAYGPGSAWDVSFDFGIVTADWPPNYLYVRAVRGGL